VALEFYQQYFSAGQFGKAAAVAVVMLIILIPVMIFNIRRFRSGSVV
jgi:alpha-glucoside transport system permease protein